MQLWNWRRGPRGGGAMDRAEAARLLGVPIDADADTVKAAHRRLMMKVHPDRGGTNDAVHEANAARDVLLARLMDRTPGSPR